MAYRDTEVDAGAARIERPSPEGGASTFLADLDGTALVKGTLRFASSRSRSRLPKSAGIDRRRNGGRQSACFHSLRHTAAVHRLESWYRQAADVQRLLPMLSIWLGHAHLDGTQVYLSITPELLHEASVRFDGYFNGGDHERSPHLRPLAPALPGRTHRHGAQPRPATRRRATGTPFALLLPFIGAKARKPVDRFTVQDLTARRVLQSRAHLEDDRGCSVQTGNQRLTAIRAFARFVASRDPTHLEWRAPRDRFIGWSRELREKNLRRVVDNPRFLILPWVIDPQPRLAHPRHRPPPAAAGLDGALHHDPRANRDLRRDPALYRRRLDGHPAGRMSAPPNDAWRRGRDLRHRQTLRQTERGHLAAARAQWRWTNTFRVPYGEGAGVARLCSRTEQRQPGVGARAR